MPVSSRIWIGPYDFDLADIDLPHNISELPIGQTGPINIAMQDWSGGIPLIEEGIQYRRLPTYIWSPGQDAVVSGQIILQSVATTVSVGSGATLGRVLRQVDFTPSGGTVNTYLIEDNTTIHKLANPLSNPVWTVAYTGANTFKDGVVHGGFLAAGMGSGGQAYTADGTTFTVATANKADAYGTLGQNLYRAVRPNTVFAATAVNGTWDAGSSIADTSFRINSLTGVEQLLMIGKEDGIYSIDADGTVTPFTPELRTHANGNFASLQASESFNGDYFFRTLNGVIQIAGVDGSKRRVGIDQLALDDSSITFVPTLVVQALAHDDRYLYAMLASDVDELHILRRTVGGRWHNFYSELGVGYTPQHMAISSVFGYPALFFSYQDNGAAYKLKFIRLSTTANPLQDSAYRFDTTGTGFGLNLTRLPRLGSAEAQMVIDEITVQSRNCSQNQTIEVLFQADDGTLTTFGTVTTSPIQTLKPSTAITANFVDLYFRLNTNDGANTPALMGFSARGVWRPNRRRMHTFTLNTARLHRDIRGGVRQGSPTQSAIDIQTLLATNTYQTVRDERGATFSGLVQEASRSTIRPKAGSDPAEVIQVLIAEKT